MSSAVALLLHRLWTKAVGTPDYIKREWQELEARIQELEQLEKSAGMVTVVHEYETVPGYEAQGRPDRLLSTTLYLYPQHAEQLAAILRARPGRRVDVYALLVNRR